MCYRFSNKVISAYLRYFIIINSLSFIRFIVWISGIAVAEVAVSDGGCAVGGVRLAVRVLLRCGYRYRRSCKVISVLRQYIIINYITYGKKCRCTYRSYNRESFCWRCRVSRRGTIARLQDVAYARLSATCPVYAFARLIILSYLYMNI